MTNASERSGRAGAEPSDASPEEILRALADPERLALAGMLARGPERCPTSQPRLP